MDSWPARSLPALPGRSPDLKIWDTASRAKVVAAQGPLAMIYACGITPYDATHIGHAATYTAWDLMIRSWRDSGHDVRYAQNVTDVDDPLLERADRDGEYWRDLAEREIERYRSDMTALRVLPPDHLIGAVEALGVIEDFSGVLRDRGALYELDRDVYALRAADPWFGSVSGYDQETMIDYFAERGGDPARAGKKDPLDPLVWLAQRPGEPHWDSRFGPGRPGWHVECAAIATHWLGVTFDVQAGGTDLIFPHHEMSASHARVAAGGSGSSSGEAGAGDGPESLAFARHYVHAGMVRYAGEKMSKSLGNLVFVSRLRQAGHDPMAIRLALLAHHYRGDWDWTDEVLGQAEERLARWRSAVAASPSASTPAGPSADPSAVGSAGAEPDRFSLEVLAAVRDRMADDLDAPGALAVIDAWADAVLSGTGPNTSAGLVAGAADALLGVTLS
jgi:L-cysteine:1D-myo-inositol 2-amino-2-deoxy-alpha-D-glucopyranoside ligase